MKDTVQSIAIVLATFLLTMILFTVMYSDALTLWQSIKGICYLTDSKPNMEAVKLPNGNLGFGITCEQKQ